MNEAVYGMTADEINYLWRNLSLYGTVRKLRVKESMDKYPRKHVSGDTMSNAVFLCEKREAERFSVENFCYDNGDAINLCEVDTGTNGYISDCGGTVAYLCDKFGKNETDAVELLSRLSCRRRLRFFGNEICIKTVKDDVLDGVSEMLSAIYKAEKFGGVELCLDRKKENLKN